MPLWYGWWECSQHNCIRPSRIPLPENCFSMEMKMVKELYLGSCLGLRGKRKAFSVCVSLYTYVRQIVNVSLKRGKIYVWFNQTMCWQWGKRKPPPTPLSNICDAWEGKKERSPELHSLEKTKGKSQLWICQKPAIHRGHKSQGNKEKWKDLVLKTHSSLNLCQHL